MRGINRWDARPYVPFGEIGEEGAPVVCRVAPGPRSAEIEWLGGAGGGSVYFAGPGAGWERRAVRGPVFRLEGLADGADTRFFIEDAAGRRSRIRLVRAGSVPGTPVDYLHPGDGAYDFSGRYLCSPSLVRLPGGGLLASADVFGHEAPQNLTLLFYSGDNGASWRYRAELFPCFWGKLFVHRGSLYMLAVSTEYGDLLLGRSDDEGCSWTMPTVLARGSGSPEAGGFHKAPVPVIRARGRLWTAVEYGSWSGPRRGFASAILSAAEGACLTAAESWTISRPLPYDASRPGAPDCPGAIEGNLVLAPDGSLCNLLRCGENRAMLLRADPLDPERAPEFVRFVDFPLGHSKFELGRLGGRYVAVGNRPPMRSVLSVFTSEDLLSWRPGPDVVNAGAQDPRTTAFQYPSFIPDGDGLLVLSRTAYNGARSYHDSNLITLHRVKL